MAYRCYDCCENFSQLDEALNHMNTHNFAQRRCVVPECHSMNPRRLIRHTCKKHRELCQYSCTQCRRRFVRESDRNLHVSMKHHGSHCQYGGTQFTVSYSSMEHYYGISSQNQGFDLNTPSTDTSLKKFIHEELQPNDRFKKLMNETVDNICSFFRREMSPREIVKGGSMGKCTAIKGKADIDLVLILNEVTSARQLERELPGLKRKIVNFLKRTDLYRDFKVKQDTIDTTAFAVKFTVEVGTEEIDVDLLPTFYFTDKDDLYDEMTELYKNQERSLLNYYSASLVKLQVDFVKCVRAKVKNLIRLVKYWNKTYVQGTKKGRLPTSYVLELITIYAWKRRHKPYRFNMLKAFHNIMEILHNVESLKVFWPKNYTESDIPAEIRNQRPLVMDPANPVNNVCSKFYWEPVKQKAGEALGSPMLRSVSSTTWD